MNDDGDAEGLPTSCVLRNSSSIELKLNESCGLGCCSGWLCFDVDIYDCVESSSISHCPTTPAIQHTSSRTCDALYWCACFLLYSTYSGRHRSCWDVLGARTVSLLVALGRNHSSVTSVTCLPYWCLLTRMSYLDWRTEAAEESTLRM